MRSLIITVAGLSSRFNRDMDNPVLKCLYHEGNAQSALLSYQISSLYENVDEIVVVGGFRFADLEAFCEREIADPEHKIKLVFNAHYANWGSGYSLICGVDALSVDSQDVVFLEGDLFFDHSGIQAVVSSRLDVLTVNREVIRSDKAVVLYVDMEDHPHYIYDTSHAALVIPDPFTAVYNSAQIWKFTRPERLRKIVAALPPKAVQGTNLEIIQRYFGVLKTSEIEIVSIGNWFNCNTVMDYRQAIKSLIG